MIVDQHGIKAARRYMCEAGKVLLCGADDALLLARIDAGRRAAEICIAPQAHLDKDQRRAVPHDQVDFAETAAEVLRDRFQAVLPQVLRRPLFSLRAVIHGCR